jgi:hypothetical protein
MSTVSFIIPTHPPHYHYLYNILPKLKGIIDIHLVFSNSKDYEMFSMKELIIPIVVNGHINTRSIITFKKFYGLKQLMQSKYDYFIVCDSEIDIILENLTEENIRSKVEKNYDNKIFYAGNIYNKHWVIDVNRVSSNLFSKDEQLKIKNITENFTLYSWFSDLHVYKRTDLSDFFKRIDYSNIEYIHFDYIIYQYWLLLERNFIIINTTPYTKMNWSLELLNEMNETLYEYLIANNYGFGWCNKTFYNNNKQFCLTNKTFIIYNIDRQSDELVKRWNVLCDK